MQFPAYPDIRRTPHIVEAMISDVAEIERDAKLAPPAEADPFVLEIGQLCLELDNAKTLEEPDIGPIPLPVGSDANRRLFNRLQYVMFAEHSRDLKSEQIKLHEAAAARLAAELAKGRDRELGYVVEFAALALLTRYAHPNFLAYPALTHHDRSEDTGGHYDVGTVIKEVTGDMDSYSLQVKLPCFGKCTGTPSAYLEKTQANYRPSIQLISGCCDLGFGGGPTTRFSTKVAHLLVREARGQIKSSREVKRLDNLTDHLLFNMTADLLPRGQRGGRSIALPAAAYLELMQ